MVNFFSKPTLSGGGNKPPSYPLKSIDNSEPSKRELVSFVRETEEKEYSLKLVESRKVDFLSHEQFPVKSGFCLQAKTIDRDYVYGPISLPAPEVVQPVLGNLSEALGETQVNPTLLETLFNFVVETLSTPDLDL